MEAVLLYRLTIPGRMPGLNEYISAERANRYQAAKMKRDWQNIVCHEIRRQLRGVKLRFPVVLAYTFHEPNRRRDHDNVAGFAHKIIQDAMVQMDILEDDGWDEIAGFVDWFVLDKKNPRIEVEILRTDEPLGWLLWEGQDG